MNALSGQTTINSGTHAYEWLTVIAMIGIFSLISLVASGYEYGTNNNVFHIPYVLDWPSLPEFAGDKFYASLKYFTSVVWLAARFFATESNVENIFLYGHIANRFLIFASIYFLIKNNASLNWTATSLCMLSVAVTPWLQGFSVLGKHDLLDNYFSHTECTWPFVFLALTCLQMRRLYTAAIMLSIAFSINMFVGFWLICVCLVVIAFDAGIRMPRTLAISAATLFVLTLPMVIWVVSAGQMTGSLPTFSWIEYVRQYYPNHFLIDAADRSSTTTLLLLWCTGLLSALTLQTSRYWISVLVGCALIFLIGIPLPYISNQQVVFDLHFLRSDGLIQAISIILTLIAGAKLVSSESDIKERLLGVIIIASLVSTERSLSSLIGTGLALSATRSSSLAQIIGKEVAGRIAFWLACGWFVTVPLYALLAHGAGTLNLLHLALAIASVSMAFQWRPLKSHQSTLLTSILIISCAINSATALLWKQQEEHHISDRQLSWNDLTTWVRSSDLHGVFLIPTFNYADSFQVQAKRPVWVDWKQGAAVMWMPDFYPQWSIRYKQVKSLKNPEEFINYAKINGIHNIVIESKSPTCPSNSKLEKFTGYFLLCSI